jgi:nicotinamide-nucleotide amidase
MTITETNPVEIPTDADLREHAEGVAEILITRGQTMVAAESCTGGWIAKVLTDIAGSSAWFECGVVAYSYEAKESLLGVQPQTLERTGAVSQETVVEMVSGALAR